jgi:hypothetical protein
MSKFLKILGIAVLLVFGLRFLSFYSYPETDDKSYFKEFAKNYAIYSAPLPKELIFAGEGVPFNDPQIIENYDRELLVNTYWQSQTVLFIKRSAKYFPVIEPILESYGIPQDFKYLPLIESGFMNVVSPAGAVGFWQIMEGTGKQYGLEITKEVDERYHLEKATHVACKYLKEAYAELGSWTLAAASYNMGITGVKKQLERQAANNFYDLTLNSETGRYVYRIMAIKHILENPANSGFHVREKDKYLNIPTYLVSVDTAVSNFGAFAEGFGINYRVLKYHNPWLRYDYLPNKSGKTYKIAIPRKGYHQVIDAENYPDEKVEEKDSLATLKATENAVEIDSLATGKQKVD